MAHCLVSIAEMKRGPMLTHPCFERIWRVARDTYVCARSVSVVSRASCSATGDLVVVKAYELARMRAKDSRRLAREIAIMRRLDRMEGMARPLSSSSHVVDRLSDLCCQHIVLHA